SVFKTLPLFQNNLFRPLMLFTEEERKNLLENLSSPIFHDDSNNSEKYTRNRIRLNYTGFLLEEGLNPYKLYWNFHEKVYLEENSPHKIVLPFCKTFIPDGITTTQLKRIIDSYLQILKLHPIKKELLFEIYSLIIEKKSFEKENIEAYFWKPEKGPLFIIPLNSNVFNSPHLKNQKIYWNNQTTSLENDYNLDSSETIKKIQHGNKTFTISELFRERNIPIRVRKNIPILMKENQAIKILFHLWDDTIPDFPKH
ncbi:MAG: hypothetical protein KDK36_21135, partial [Leptospiraceae bacterium]|nr:hypothetical protein [Leptospiraceae bacterium]